MHVKYTKQITYHVQLKFNTIFISLREIFDVHFLQQAENPSYQKNFKLVTPDYVDVRSYILISTVKRITFLDPVGHCV